MMKKTLWVLLFALALGLSGCGVAEIPETSAPLVEMRIPYEAQERQLQYEDVQLRLQSIWLQEDPQARILLEAAALFEEQTGAVVTIRWPTEDCPTPENPQETDIFQLRAADFAALPAEYVLDLTEMAAQADYESKSHETLRQQITQACGFLGAIPQVPYLGGIYYSTEAFSQCGILQLPRTWDEFLTLCQTLRENGWQPLTMDKEDALVAMELHLRRTIGNGEIERMMGKTGRWDTNLPAIAALEQVMLFVQDGNLATGAPADYPAGQNKVATSNSAMMVGTNADCADVEEAALTDLSWGVFPYPGNTGSGTYMTADVLLIHGDCPNAQAAFDFIMLLTTGEFDQLRADISKGIPADPANASPIAGAMETIRDVQPEPLTFFGPKQLDTAVKLWSGWYKKAARYASLLEINK